jgi:DUF4097 and DUF4098 domain-containing protein YvlB
MAGAPPPYPPPGPPPPGYDPRDQRRYERDQQRAQRDAIRAQQEQLRFHMRSLRRGSILGPLLLIAVGVVFLLLQTGRLDAHFFWEWYGSHWPLLLVAAGILLLAEWAFDQFYLRDPEHPRYRRSIGGGIFFLLLFFGVLGVIANSGMSFHPTQSNLIFNGFHLAPESFDRLFGDKHESDQTLDLAFPQGSSLAVVNPSGDVTISGTSADNKIHVAIHKQVYALSDTDADAKAQQLSLAVTSGDAFSISMPAVEGARADLILTVPASTVTVTANRGDIHVASIKGAVTVTANHGDIDLSDVTGPATARINNRGSSISARNMGGGITIAGHAQDATLSDITGPVSFAGDFYGTTHFERINGPVHFHTSRSDLQLVRLDGQFELSGSDLSIDQALGPVVLTTSHNNVVLDRIAGDVSVTNHNGSIDLTAAPTLGAITLQDRVGSIKVILPEHSGFAIQADTTNGDIDTDLPFSATTAQDDSSRSNNNSNRDRRKTIGGTVAPGGPLVHISTTNGDISIHKGPVAPISATPPAPPKLAAAPAAPPTSPRVTKQPAK